MPYIIRGKIKYIRLNLVTAILNLYSVYIYYYIGVLILFYL